MKRIKFGTSGWRAIIADDFTFENVRIVSQAIAEQVKSVGGPEPSVIVGRDTRFLGAAAAKQTVGVLAGNGIKVLWCQDPTPTPAISAVIRKKKLTGGINFTASHNPPQYNGIKFSPESGGPALPEVTDRIEAEANRLLEQPAWQWMDPDEAMNSGLVEPFDARELYLKELKRHVDMKAIRKAGLKVVADPMFGAAIGYLDAALDMAGCKVTGIHDYPDPTFGGSAPEPGEEHVGPLAKEMKRRKADLGLATDGDADRFGVLDAGGVFINPNYLLAILFEHLIKTRGWKGLGVARTVATTHLIDNIAHAHGIEVFEVPVGFKFIGELIDQDRIMIGGEESAGLSIRNHTTDKDGIIACLLAAEAVAVSGRPLSQSLKKIQKKYGPVFAHRINVALTPEIQAGIKDKLAQDFTELEGWKVARIDRTDGAKFIFEDGSWLLFRISGTEPVARIYAEAHKKKHLKQLEAIGARLLLGK